MEVANKRGGLWLFQFESFIKFGLVGATSATIYFSTMWIFSYFLSPHYLICVSISYIASVVFHYFANSIFTFNAAKTVNHLQITKYLTMLLINYCISIAIIRTVVENLHLSAYLGIALSILCTMVPGYFMGKYWIFKS